MFAALWTLLTEPAPAVVDPQGRRQARLMAAVLVVALPAYAVMALAAGLTREVPVQPADAGLGLLHFALGVLAYGLIRTRHYRVGATLLAATAVVSSVTVGIREQDPLRALVSFMLGLTGVVYAGFMLSSRTTLVAGIAHVLLVGLGVALHVSVTVGAAVLPLFLLLFVHALTVAGAALRERHVADLERQKELLEATTRAAHDAVVVLDGEQRVLSWSGQAEAIFGLSASQAVCRRLAELVLLEPDEGSRAVLEALVQRRRAQLEFRAVTSAGRAFPCEASLSPLSAPHGAVVFFRDLSERKRVEGKLVFADRLETMGRLVAGVAHEINNPLGFIRSNLAFLKEELASAAVEPDVLAAIDETADGARRIQAIVQDLRGFAYDGPSYDRLAPVDVERALDAAIRLAESQLRTRSANVRREYGEVGSVMAVENRVCQVFLNILANAAQALPKDGSGSREIVVRTKEVDDRVAIAIEDKGSGIAPDVAARLFTPFFTTKAVGEGTGLGLYICQLIVSGLRGEIRVDSAPGRGSVFEVWLWRDGPAAADRETAATPKAGEQP